LKNVEGQGASMLPQSMTEQFVFELAKSDLAYYTSKK
jgi:hypothetical protein